MRTRQWAAAVASTVGPVTAACSPTPQTSTSTTSTSATTPPTEPAEQAKVRVEAAPVLKSYLAAVPSAINGAHWTEYSTGPALEFLQFLHEVRDAHRCLNDLGQLSPGQRSRS